jgi:hypothetical protein
MHSRVRTHEFSRTTPHHTTPHHTTNQSTNTSTHPPTHQSTHPRNHATTQRSFFGPITRDQHHEKIDLFRKYLTSSIRPVNYRALLTAWTHRTDILPTLHEHPITIPTIVFYGGNSLRHEQIPE